MSDKEKQRLEKYQNKKNKKRKKKKERMKIIVKLKSYDFW